MAIRSHTEKTLGGFLLGACPSAEGFLQFNCNSTGKDIHYTKPSNSEGCWVFSMLPKIYLFQHTCSKYPYPQAHLPEA